MKVGDEFTVDITPQLRPRTFAERIQVTVDGETYTTRLELYTIRRVHLKLVETRAVPDLYAAGYSGKPVEELALNRTGRRAQDVNGMIWFQDWEGTANDGPGNWMTKPYGQPIYATETRPNDDHLGTYCNQGRAYAINEAAL